jgi:hypothetical protein
MNNNDVYSIACYFDMLQKCISLIKKMKTSIEKDKTHSAFICLVDYSIFIAMITGYKYDKVKKQVKPTDRGLFGINFVKDIKNMTQEWHKIFEDPIFNGVLCNTNLIRNAAIHNFHSIYFQQTQYENTNDGSTNFSINVKFDDMKTIKQYYISDLESIVKKIKYFVIKIIENVEKIKQKDILYLIKYHNKLDNKQLYNKATWYDLFK